MSFARTIVESAQVQAAIDAAIAKHPLTEKLWDALKWLLARDPIPEGALELVSNGSEVTYAIRTRDRRPLFPIIRLVARYNRRPGIKVEILHAQVIF